jgi:hypothetical protein
MNLLSYFTFTVIACLLLATSCQQDAADWSYSTDDTMAGLAFDDIYNVMSGEDDNNNQLRSCATLTLVTTPGTTYPITVTAIFGGATSSCGDGRVRSGTLTAVYSGRWFSTGSVVTITSDAADPYTVSGYVVEGVNTITNTSVVGGSTSFTSVVTNGKVTTTGGDEILRSGTRHYEMTGGVTTPLDVTDDVWQLTGNINGTTSTGKQYTATIDAATPVVKAQSCKWVQSGVIEITPASGGVLRTIDYGNGACDSKAAVTYGSWSMDIVMQ